MIHLSLGALQIDWGKNSHFADHSSLFQKFDLKDVLDHGYDDPLEMEGYSRPLGNILARLELLGYTLKTVRSEFATTENEWGSDYYPKKLSFSKFCRAIARINVAEYSGTWDEMPEGKFVPKEILDKIEHHDYRTGRRPDYWDAEVLLGGLSPYSKLRILAENPNNLQVPLIWPFGALVDSGWAKREDFLRELDLSERFLIVTEGSSDSLVIRKALDLLRPDIADFFRFIDMEDGYPFSGTGNLFKFCQGLVSIGISNPVLILYDNDTEGVTKYEATKKLRLPPNMVVTKLPDLKALNRFNTIGPFGERKSDINGTAASIECYLDLGYKQNGRIPRVRWSSYSEGTGKYQGAIERKTSYVKNFLGLRCKSANYDFSKLDAVLAEIYRICVDMKCAGS